MFQYAYIYVYIYLHQTKLKKGTILSLNVFKFYLDFEIYIDI